MYIDIAKEKFNTLRKDYNKKDIIKQIAKNKGTNKNEIYQYFLDY